VDFVEMSNHALKMIIIYATKRTTISSKITSSDTITNNFDDIYI
jgi:hypothetical protein